ncbi:hypothetical protein Bca4012_096624 [Brassica carinata]
MGECFRVGVVKNWSTEAKKKFQKSWKFKYNDVIQGTAVHLHTECLLKPDWIATLEMKITHSNMETNSVPQLPDLGNRLFSCGYMMSRLCMPRHVRVCLPEKEQENFTSVGKSVCASGSGSEFESQSSFMLQQLGTIHHNVRDCGKHRNVADFHVIYITGEEHEEMPCLLHIIEGFTVLVYKTLCFRFVLFGDEYCFQTDMGVGM